MTGRVRQLFRSESCLRLRVPASLTAMEFSPRSKASSPRYSARIAVGQKLFIAASWQRPAGLRDLAVGPRFPDPVPARLPQPLWLRLSSRLKSHVHRPMYCAGPCEFVSPPSAHTEVLSTRPLPARSA